jgi:Cu+-exporting ATPase
MKNTITLKIKGMACTSCAGTIQQALSNADGVEHAEVDFGKKKAFITTTAQDKAALIKLVQSVGYDAV